ncbi:MAG: hypothetical protein QNJ04_04535 [Desulfobacterales bacterium]|nr:hypothetical protein [Desulfobacterales bacterium]
MPAIDLSLPSRAFLENLYTRTGDDTDAQISMYELGTAMGLDREESRTTAEDLMAAGLLEIRTLSGGVALSEAGHALFADTDAGESGSTDGRLGEGSPMDPRQRELVEQTLTQLKADMGNQNLSFEAMTEMVADVRTIEAQLTSPRSKTSVVRACLAGLRDLTPSPWRERLDSILD